MIINGATQLRTLTLKSPIKFGVFKHNTVGELIDIYNHVFLIKLYYNASNINFSEEVLNILKITPERRIKKPGKNIRGDMIGVVAACLQEIRDEATIQDEKIIRKMRNFQRKRKFSKQLDTEYLFQKKDFNRELNRTRVTK